METITYLRNAIKSVLGGKEITFISSTPQYNEQQKEKVHAEIERGLYTVFAKYVLAT